MNKTTLLIMAALLIACGALVEERDWSFVKAVGGMSIGTPREENGEWLLPVEADVSGLRTVTVKPTTLNSALACKEVRSSVNNNVIHLSLITALAAKGHSSTCPAAKLGTIAPGRYVVFYGGRKDKVVRLGEVNIGL
jgi:hypothetical protein